MTYRNPSYSGETFTPQRPGLQPTEISGPTAYWPDGLTTYTLAFKDTGALWSAADEADTALAAMVDLRSGKEMSKDLLDNRINDVQSLINRLTAVKEELLLYAREAGPDGKPRMSWRDIAGDMGRHFTTIKEQHEKVATGGGSGYRNWLVQDTPREHMYPTADGQPSTPPPPRAEEPKEAPAHATGVYDWPEREGFVIARCTCGWEGNPGGNVITASLAGKDHENGADA